MKFLADEKIPLKTIEGLRGRGINIVSILDSGRGLKDERVLGTAYQQDGILITFDKDFGELLRAPAVTQTSANIHRRIPKRSVPLIPEVPLGTITVIPATFASLFLERKLRC